MTLFAKTTAGIFWNFTQQLATRGVGILVTLILARLLVPEDFGLVAMIALFLALGNSLMESGFRQALIRLEKITQKDYNTAFYANIFLGLVAYITLYVLSPIISNFYNEPKLKELVRVSSLSIIIMSFQVVQVARLCRELNFKVQLKASLPASILSGLIAVYLAYIGLGVWALVLQTLLNSFFNTLLLWKVEGWRPSLEVSWHSLKKLYNFGYKLFLAGFISTVFQNAYIVVISKLYSVKVSGLYFFAEKIRNLLIQQLVSSIQSATYPALAKIQNDDKQLKIAYKNIVVAMTTILFPIFLLIAALAEPIFQLIFEQEWWPAIPYFQLLCIASLMLPLHAINLNILNVKGRSDLFLYIEIAKKIIICIVLALTFKYGVITILYGQVVISFISYILNGYFSKKIVDYGLIEQIKDFYVSLIIAILGFIVSVFVLNNLEFSPLISIFIISILYLVVYTSGSMVFNNKKIITLLNLFIKVISRKNLKN